MGRMLPRVYVYGLEFVWTGLGVVIGDAIGYFMIAAGLAAIIVTAFRAGHINVSFGKMSISEAAALMYNKATDQTRSLARVGSTISDYNSPDKHFVQILRILAARGDIKVWGREAEGLKAFAIAPDMFVSGLVVIRNNTLVSILDDEPPSWIDLTISRADARKALRIYEDDDRERIV